MNGEARPATKFGILLKLGFYAFLVVIGLPVYALALSAAGYLIAAAGSTFGAGITANTICLRVFERLPLPAVGLGWRPGSGRNLLIGFVSGIAGAALVTLAPLAAGLAELVPDPQHPASAASLLFVSVVLLFGVVGEELLFRGYAFQLLISAIGKYQALLLASCLFGAVHLSNPDASALGIANTVGFGLVLGYAFLKSGDLWLPIGVHFGWNWLLPLAGVSLSGFKIGVTGYALRWRVSDLWSGGAYGPEASVLTCGIIAAFLFFLRKAPLSRSEPVLLARRSLEA
jgi:membrane protease YdiL (CAAX protease family)